MRLTCSSGLHPVTLATSKERRQASISSLNSSTTANGSASLLDEEYALRTSMDELLGPASPATLHSHLFNPPTTRARTKLFGLVTLIVSSTLAARLAPFAALSHRRHVLALPVVHFLFLGLFGLVRGWLNPRGKFGGARIGIGRADEGERRMAAFVGGLSAVAFVLGLWQARSVDARVWNALELFVVPCLVVLPPLLPTLFSSALRAPPNPHLHLALISLVFLVGFSLLGLPHAAGLGLLLTVSRLPIEALRWMLLKQGMSGEKMGGFLLACAVTGFVTSSLFFILDLVSPSASSSTVATTTDLVTLVLYTLTSLVHQSSLLFTIYAFSSPLSSVYHLIPRNLFLLLLSTLGRGAQPLRGNWEQTCFVLLFGCFATACTDPEIYSAVKECISFERKRSGYASSNGNSYDLAASGSRSPSPNSSPTLDSAPRLPRPAYTSSILFSLMPFLPLCIYLFQSSPPTPAISSTACSLLPSSFQQTLCRQSTSTPSSQTVDLVFAYYDENAGSFKAHLDGLRKSEFVRRRSNRVLVYNKGRKSEKELRFTLGLKDVDEVIPLPNLGREGATYLDHILLHYNATLDSFASFSTAPTRQTIHASRVLADHTYFLQPHLAWEKIAQPRLELVDSGTGFAHFGPMMRNHCGPDGRGTGDFPIIKQLYNIFVGELCPPDGVLSAWSAQFVVSKRRVLSNSYARYRSLLDMMHAPEGHWIHDMWGPNNSAGPSNPAVGHSVERSWPLIFGCVDPKIADECPDDVHVQDRCQCRDV